MIKSFRRYIKENYEEPGSSTPEENKAGPRGDLIFSDDMLYVEERHLYGMGRVSKGLKDKVHSLKDSGKGLPIFFTIIGTEKKGALFIESDGEILYTFIKQKYFS